MIIHSLPDTITEMTRRADMNINELKEMLYSVDRSYDDFVSLVVSFVKIPENSSKGILIRDYIVSHPRANSSDVLEYMISELGMANNPSNQELVIA